MPGHGTGFDPGRRRRVLMLALAASDLIACSEDARLFDDWPTLLVDWGESACADLIRNALEARVRPAGRSAAGAAALPTVSRDQVSIAVAPDLPG